jgi:acyl-homoserine-lactone acylase
MEEEIVNAMKRSLAVAVQLALVVAAAAQSPQTSTQLRDRARWAQEAKSVRIIRDDWGIAHVYGKADSDAVFGMIYAQCEDDFNRVETNYLNSLGRLAEAEGESRIWQDLRMKLFIDPVDLQAKYAQSPKWLQKLMDGWADGANFYLATHPEVKPRVIQRFEPWMALSFTEGSIGGDIERVDLRQLEAFYGRPVSAEPMAGGVGSPEQKSVAGTELAADVPLDEFEREPSGSNGFAIAPGNTAAHHALLLINPHTSFFFRVLLSFGVADGQPGRPGRLRRGDVGTVLYLSRIQ